MIEVVGVRFKQGNRTYYFDPNHIFYRKNTEVVVETKNGLEVGTIISENKKVDKKDIVLPLKTVVRKVEKDDYKKIKKNEQAAQKAETVFQNKVLEEKLDIQLVEVRYNFEATHVVFSYTADARVDFRNLVKKLAQNLRVRIEMRQINMREKARLIGGIGPCGYDLCCNTFLQDLHGSTIKMVKNQKLTLVPERISGLCGKLLCCLRYENDTYTELAAMLPDVNQQIKTPDGIGKVIYVNVLTQKIDVLFRNDAGVHTKKQYEYSELQEELLDFIPQKEAEDKNVKETPELTELEDDTNVEVSVTVAVEKGKGKTQNPRRKQHNSKQNPRKNNKAEQNPKQQEVKPNQEKTNQNKQVKKDTKQQTNKQKPQCNNKKNKAKQNNRNAKNTQQQKQSNKAKQSPKRTGTPKNRRETGE